MTLLFVGLMFFRSSLVQPRPPVRTGRPRSPSSIVSRQVGTPRAVLPLSENSADMGRRRCSGLANASFGIECARLAGVPDAVLVRAREQSAALKETVNHKAETKRCTLISSLLYPCATSSLTLPYFSLAGRRKRGIFSEPHSCSRRRGRPMNSRRQRACGQRGRSLTRFSMAARDCKL